MAAQMVSFRAPGGPPTAEQIEKRYSLPAGVVDRAFGVVEVDDILHEYTIMVSESFVNQIATTADWDVVGSFSNPRISPQNQSDP